MGGGTFACILFPTVVAWTIKTEKPTSRVSGRKDDLRRRREGEEMYDFAEIA